MTFFEKNVEVLTSTFPSLDRSVLHNTENGINLTIAEARNGMPTASVNGRFLHSQFNPQKEARLFVDSLEETGSTIFFGFGLGYFVEEFVERHPDRRVIVVEPDPEVLRVALESRDLQNVCGARNISLLLDVKPDSVAAFLNSYPTTKIGVAAATSLLQVNEEYYASLHKVMEAYEARREINTNTINRFGRRWIRNLVGNLHLIPTAKPLRTLENSLTNIPALLVAAGPSLDSVLPALPELAERCIVIAVDTSFRAVARTGVQPDFLVVVDPQYWNARHLDGCVTDRISLITESATYPTIFRRPYKAIFFGDSLFPLGSFVERGLGPFGKLGAGGSVATSAWDIARVLGCSPVYTAGLDLGFPLRNTHFRGSRFEEMQQNSAARLNPTETGSYRMLNDAAPFYIEANDGGQVLTDKRLITYKWWFENQIKMYPDVSTYNLSAGGVKIEGMPHASIQSLLDLPTINDRGKLMVESAPFEPEEMTRRKNTLDAAAANILTELRQVKELSTQALNLSHELVDAAPSRIEEIIALLSNIDGRLLLSSAKDVAGFLAQDAARKIIEASQVSNKAMEATESSSLMYGELEESADYHIRLLERSVSP